MEIDEKHYLEKFAQEVVEHIGLEGVRITIQSPQSMSFALKHNPTNRTDFVQIDMVVGSSECHIVGTINTYRIRPNFSVAYNPKTRSVVAFIPDCEDGTIRLSVMGYASYLAGRIKTWHMETKDVEAFAQKSDDPTSSFSSIIYGLKRSPPLDGLATKEKDTPIKAADNTPGLL